ncbi:hypothetical protein OTB20_22015 [Streptomyces sp. H27-H1]|uniref:hypothetical protein n=1 Tax=Streptomyces sp. H27-H1 TaxID=2996461 RepID=UPI0022701B7C|nr:hypothetical protein [Streptomyces sp. H27-H1]MCY0928837.1 hypothetical protein [Streptomyces sp. H27-H1]
MSAVHATGIRKTAGQFALALLFCTAVAGGAAVVASSSATAAQHSVADGVDLLGSSPSPTPTSSNGNGWDSAKPVLAAADGSGTPSPSPSSSNGNGWDSATPVPAPAAPRD